MNFCYAEALELHFKILHFLLPELCESDKIVVSAGAYG